MTARLFWSDLHDPANACVSAAEEGLPPEWGAMGIHYLNMARLQITGGDPRVDGIGAHTDFMAPTTIITTHIRAWLERRRGNMLAGQRKTKT